MDTGGSGEILVVGAGAIGRVFGAHLARSGSRAVLFDINQAVVDEINRDGVRLARDGAEERVEVEAVTDLAGRDPVAVAIFCVKAYATRPAAGSTATVIDDATTIVSLQNGWGNGETLADCFDAGRVVVGVTYNSATIAADSTVLHTAGKTQVGPFAGDDKRRAESLAGLFTGAGLETEAVANVHEEIWRKLILNAATLPTAALTGLAAGPLGAHPEMGPLVDDVTREAVAVANALGYEIAAEERIELIRGVLERVGDGKGSMLQDLEANRRTEIETITGAVRRAAHESGVPAPLHEGLYALVRGVESARGLS